MDYEERDAITTLRVSEFSSKVVWESDGVRGTTDSRDRGER
jgi:hypothetical protein